MGKIYWFINQFCKRGGTEIVTNQIINFLCHDYEIEVVLLDNDKINYDLFTIKPDYKITQLDIDKSIIRNEDYFSKNVFKNIALAFKIINFSLFKKKKYRQLIKEHTTKDDILIFCSPYGMMIAPKDRNNYFHVHYNSRYINKSLNRVIINALSVKPKEYILLTEETCKSSHLHPTTFIYNPVRIKQKERYEVGETVHLVFMARYEKDKNPLLALHVLNELAKINKNFTCDFYGKGYLKEEMIEYVNNNKRLSNTVRINGKFNSPEEILSDKDIMIMTSYSEGFGLTIIESACYSIPTVLFDFGAGCDEVVHNGIDSIVIKKFNAKEMANSLNELINNKEKLIQLKKGAYINSKRFSEDIIKLKWKEFLNEQFKQIGH